MSHDFRDGRVHEHEGQVDGSLARDGVDDQRTALGVVRELFQVHAAQRLRGERDLGFDATVAVDLQVVGVLDDIPVDVRVHDEQVRGPNGAQGHLYRPHSAEVAGVPLKSRVPPATIEVNRARHRLLGVVNADNRRQHHQHVDGDFRITVFCIRHRGRFLFHDGKVLNVLHQLRHCPSTCPSRRGPCLVSIRCDRRGVVFSRCCAPGHNRYQNEKQPHPDSQPCVWETKNDV